MSGMTKPSRRTFLIGAAAVAAGAGCSPAPKPPEDGTLREIVFGSCIKSVDHPMLDRTLTLPMDLFLFLGDNVYADTKAPAIMRAKYDELKASRFWKGLQKKAPFLATWDDHDYGGDDAGASWPIRREAQEEYLRWLDPPADSPLRRREGVYDARVIGPPGRRVQVLLLDTRYFRSPLKKGKHEVTPSGGPYVPEPDPAATMLGADQWAWLEEQLRQPAELRLVASSIQFSAAFHGGECWANFPLEQQRLMDLIVKTRANGVLFLSGDRHWSELSKLEGPSGYPFYDLTSSSLTQKHARGTPTPNRFRDLPETFHHENAGLLRIDWERPDPSLALEILDAAGAVRIAKRLSLGELGPAR
jgi:alkaline phosphatase D